MFHTREPHAWTPICPETRRKWYKKNESIQFSTPYTNAACRQGLCVSIKNYTSECGEGFMRVICIFTQIICVQRETETWRKILRGRRESKRGVKQSNELQPRDIYSKTQLVYTFVAYLCTSWCINVCAHTYKYKQECVCICKGLCYLYDRVVCTQGVKEYSWIPFFASHTNACVDF